MSDFLVQLRHLLQNPDWQALQQADLDRLLKTPPPTRPSQPVVPRKPGPAKPRAAEVGDLMKAIWSIPSIRNASNQVANQASLNFRRGWKNAPGKEKAAVVSSAVVIGGSALAAVLSNRQTRSTVLDLIVDKDIPVPKVDGLTVRLRPRGAGATYNNIAGSGVTVNVGAQRGKEGRNELEAVVTVDVAKYLRSW